MFAFKTILWKGTQDSFLYIISGNNYRILGVGRVLEGLPHMSTRGQVSPLQEGPFQVVRPLKLGHSCLFNQVWVLWVVLDQMQLSSRIQKDLQFWAKVEALVIGDAWEWVWALFCNQEVTKVVIMGEKTERWGHWQRMDMVPGVKSDTRNQKLPGG